MNVPASQAMNKLTSRLVIKGAFGVFFVWACIQLWRFYAWARDMGPKVDRPEAVAGLLPVGHFTSFFAWLKGGGWDTILPAGLVIIIGALALSLVFKRGFCGWVCPLGALWEAAAWVGARVLGGRPRPWRWVDLAGRGFRYLLAAAALAFLLMVPLEEALAFRELHYMWTADIKILTNFTEPLFLALIALTFVVSMALGPVWCRWLCPLGGWYAPLGVLSLGKVHRDPESCTHCHACSQACHAFVNVEKRLTVSDAECDGCMDCVRACPVKGCLSPRFFGRIRVSPEMWVVMAVGLWLAVWGVAKITGNWDASIPDEVFREVIASGIVDRRTPGGF